MYTDQLGVQRLARLWGTNVPRPTSVYPKPSLNHDFRSLHYYYYSSQRFFKRMEYMIASTERQTRGALPHALILYLLMLLILYGVHEGTRGQR